MEQIHNHQAPTECGTQHFHSFTPCLTLWSEQQKQKPANKHRCSDVCKTFDKPWILSLSLHQNDVVFLLASPLSNTNLRPPLKVIFIGQNINVSFRRRSGFWPNRVLTNVYMHSSVGATVSYLTNREQRTGEMKHWVGVALSSLNCLKMKVDFYCCVVCKVSIQSLVVV